MSCNKFLKTTGVAVTGTPGEVLPYNIHRKGLFLTAVGGTVKVAIGEAPATGDYFEIAMGVHLLLDTLVPIGAVWASGTGTLVYGESV